METYEEDTKISLESIQTRKRIILMPLPIHGHLTPMFQLANLLHTHGFKIIIILPQHFSFNHSDYPHFTFKSISDGFSEIHKYMPKDPDSSFFIKYLNENCIDSLRDCLAGLLAEPDESPVACLITDTEYYLVQDVANSLKVPRLVTWACNIIPVLVFRDLSLFYNKGYFNHTIKDPEYEMRVPEYPILKFRDIAKVAPKNNMKGYADYKVEMDKQMKASSGIIWQTFGDPEDILEKLTQDYPIPKFTLGPLQMYAPDFTNKLVEQDRTFFSWLDAQAPKSVIYISFGSISSTTKSEFQELAYGLANVTCPFLWVVRPGVVKGYEWIEWLPEKFLERVGDRGRIVKWCPQREVLAHPATGCFWTHGGWNSTLESVCIGVPMIYTPCIVGQPIVARYASEFWKIGVLLEDDQFDKTGIERVIKRVMFDKEGEEIRERISRMKEGVTMSFEEGGSSHSSLKSLVDYISSL